MRINEHRKKGCDKAMDSKRESSQTKVVPTIKKCSGGCANARRRKPRPWRFAKKFKRNSLLL
jgi:hypothetical protein